MKSRNNSSEDLDGLDIPVKKTVMFGNTLGILEWETIKS
jgi:hypothetical protein